MKSIANTLMLFITIVTFSQTVEFQTITVNPYLSFQNYEHFKRLTLSSSDSEVEYIDDFQFQWGYTYKLKVKRTKLESALSDGTQYDYTLEKIMNRTKEADTAQFKLFLDAERYFDQVDSTEQGINTTLIAINDTTFLYFDKVEIEVPLALKQEFQTIVEGKTRKVGTFVFVNEKRIRLIKL